MDTDTTRTCQKMKKKKEKKSHLRPAAAPGVEHHEIAVGLQHGREFSVDGRDAPTDPEELVHAQDVVFSPEGEREKKKSKKQKKKTVRGAGTRRGEKREKKKKKKRK